MASKRGPAPKTGNVTNITDARRNSRAKKSQTAPAKKSAPNRTFNHEKVASLKAAIAAGTYSINAQRIADKFIEKESP